MTGNPDTLLTIDTHHHILPDFFWRETNDFHAPVGGLAPLKWSKEAMISFMDDAGIDVAVTSVSTPGVHLGNNEKARSLARRCNEFAAELVHDRPDRFASSYPKTDNDVGLALSQTKAQRRQAMSFRISTLLTRNLHDVFGENDPRASALSH
jgi:predicted TIM-barrel fold metal-dependent hydrolase